METTDLIKEVANSVRDLLIEKNITYGDSATNPKKIFSKGSSVDSLCARIDDKLSRIANKGITDKTEDTVSDLIGYLILLKVAIYKEKHGEYQAFKETIESGGHVNINGSPISTIENLQVHYDNIDEYGDEEN